MTPRGSAQKNHEENEGSCSGKENLITRAEKPRRKRGQLQRKRKPHHARISAILASHASLSDAATRCFTIRRPASISFFARGELSSTLWEGVHGTVNSKIHYVAGTASICSFDAEYTLDFDPKNAFKNTF